MQNAERGNRLWRVSSFLILHSAFFLDLLHASHPRVEQQRLTRLPAKEVARKLDVSVPRVYFAKCKIGAMLKRQVQRLDEQDR